jgi:hypothetical protein
MAQEVFRRRRGCEDDEQPGHLVTMKSDENVEKLRTLVRTDCHCGIRMITEEMNVEKDMVRQILTTNLNMKKVCAKMVPKNLPVLSLKTNTNSPPYAILTRSFPM